MINTHAFICIFASVAALTLASCSSTSTPQTAGEHMQMYAASSQENADLKTEFSKDWEHGQTTLETGKSRVASGEKRIKSAQKELRKAREQVRRGNEEMRVLTNR